MKENRSCMFCGEEVKSVSIFNIPINKFFTAIIVDLLNFKIWKWFVHVIPNKDCRYDYLREDLTEVIQ